MLLYVNTLNFIYARDGGYAVHCGLQFSLRMNGKVNCAETDIISCFRAESTHGELEFFSDAVHEITQKMVSVNSPDTDADRIQTCRTLIETHRNYGITIL